MTRSRRWLIGGLLLTSLLWATALCWAPYFIARAASGRPAPALAAAIVYGVGERICHQQSARSSRLWGVQMPVCARCEGIYLAAPLGAGVWLRLRRRASLRRASRRGWQVAVGAAMVVTGATVVWEWGSGVMTPHLVRGLAGVLLGGVVAAAVAAVAADDLR